MKRILLLFCFFPLVCTNVYACGFCIDYQVDLAFPFFRLWAPVFLIWLIARLLFWLLGKLQKISLPLSYAKRPWHSLIIRIILFIVVSFFTLGSFLVPFALVILPSWFFSIFTCFKKLRPIFPKHILQKIFLTFQGLVICALILLVPYSQTLPNSTEWLLKKLDHPHLSGPIKERLIAQGEKAIPGIKAMINSFDETNMRSREVYSNLMPVVRGIGNPELAKPVSVIFNRIQYKDDLYFDAVIIESAKTICALDKTLALETVLPKFIEVGKAISLAKTNQLDIFLGLSHSLFKTNDPNIRMQVLDILLNKLDDFGQVEVDFSDNNTEKDMRIISIRSKLIKEIIPLSDSEAFKRALTDENMNGVLAETKYFARDLERSIMKDLGSPDYGRDEQAYRKWWQENKEKILKPQ